MTHHEIQDAYTRIHPHLLTTPLLHSPSLSQECQGRVYLKMESEQYTGSFKARGALNKLLWLKERDPDRPVITASTGNHGLGVARALSLLGMKGRIVIPENTVSAKVEALLSLGAEVEFHGTDCFVSEMYAKKVAGEEGLVYISPYNDPQVIGGQGTIGIEIGQQCPEPIDNVFVTIGGGGLISGIGLHMKTASPNVRILGCQPENSPEMTLSVRSNSYQTVEPMETLSDASAGAFEEDSITFDLCKQLVDDFFLVSEAAIAQAIHLILAKERKLIEGAAGVAVAALLQNAERFKGQTSVVIICGGNISVEKLQYVLCG